MTPESGFSGIHRLGDESTDARAIRKPPDRTLSEQLPRRAVQPVGTWHQASTPDGRLGLAVHGEIFNKRDLCRQLRIAESLPLAQIVLAGWQRWAAGFLTHADGAFTLAVQADDDLFLYRDASSLRNLYFVTGRGGEVGFATHLNSLPRSAGTAQRIARHSLHEFLRFGDIAAPSTIFEKVQALEAGQLLRCTASGIAAHEWREHERRLAVPVDFEAAVDQLDTRLLHSVEARIEGVSRPAAFLSGGVDSSLICALASRLQSDTTAITVGFDGAAFDEAPLAQRIALHLGMRHEVLRFSRDELVSAFERLSQQLEQPTADPATPATLLAFDHCRSRFGTVLDGTGADEAVGDMPPRHVRLAVGYASLLPTIVRGPVARLLGAIPAISGYAPILDFEHPADTMIRWKGFTRHEIEELCDEPVSFENTQFYRTYARFSRRAHFERYSALLGVMPSDRLSQAELITGARIRYPFCDAQTDRFLRQLPVDFRYLPGEPKRILRALLARYVPREIWNVPKHGFNFPLREFLAADDFALVRRYLDAGAWRQSRVLSAERVQHYAHQFMAGDAHLTFRVWALVMLGAWLEKHDEML